MSRETEHLEIIKETIIDGDEDTAPVVVQEALESGVPALTILNESLMPGADEVGRLFESGEFFLPELMLTGRALQAAMDVLTPALQAEQAGEAVAVKDTGIVVMATVLLGSWKVRKPMLFPSPSVPAGKPSSKSSTIKLAKIQLSVRNVASLPESPITAITTLINCPFPPPATGTGSSMPLPPNRKELSSKNSSRGIETNCQPPPDTAQGPLAEMTQSY